MSEELNKPDTTTTSEEVPAKEMKGYVLGPHAVDLTENKDGGVMKEIRREGEGDERPLKGDTVFVHYVGTLLSDGTKFDSSRDRNEKFDFSLGQGAVIKGWDIGVASMRRGELAVLVCKAEYAYGADGSSPNIPPNADLVFEVELFDWRGEDVSESKDESILKSLLTEGEGYRTPHEMASCTIHLIGRHENRVFQDETLSFTVGEVFDGAIVPGIEQAVQKMRKGEKALLKIKSKHVYGAEGNAKFNIPPNANVEYEIELQDFDEPKDSWKLDNKEKISESEIAKSKGTELFKAGHYKEAARYYKRIIELISAEDSMEGEEAEQRSRLLLAAHLNNAMCNLKLNKYTEAIESCDDALKLDHKNEKGLFRRGLAYLNLRDFDAAASDFRATLQIEPSNGAAKKHLASALETIRQRKEQEKKTYRGMFDKFAKEDERKTKEQKFAEPVGEPNGADKENYDENKQDEKGDAKSTDTDIVNDKSDEVKEVSGEISVDS